ncbi:hypothetical protein Tco_1182216 [Tanacetum coccineum]
MAYTSLGSSSSSSLDIEVSTCSKACLKSYETLKEHYDKLTKDFNKSQLNVGAYKAGLESVKARLDVYKKNEVVFEEDIKILKLDIMLRDNALTELRKKFEKAEKERDDLKLTLEKFENLSKNLSKLLDSQISDKFKSGLGFDSQGFDSQVFDSQVFDSQVNDRYKTCDGYHVVPPLYTRNFMPPKSDLVLADKDEYVFSESVTSVPATAISKVKTSKSRPKSVSEPLIEDWVSDIKSPKESVKKVENNKQAKYPRKNSQSHRVNTAGQNSSRVATSVNTAKPSNTAYPRPTVNSAKTASNVFNRAHSYVRRTSNKFTTNKNSDFKEKVNIVRENVATIGPKAVVSDNKGNEANAVKALACWVWRPKHKVLDHGNPQLKLQEKEVIDSGCSRHMTGNKSYPSDYEEINGRFVAFDGNSKGGKARVETVPGKDYILLPFLTQDLLFTSSSKDSPDPGFKPSGEEEKKDAKDPENEDNEVPNTEELRVNQEKDESVNSTNNINTVSSTVNTASLEDNVVDENLVYGCDDDPNMPNLEDIIY